MNWRDRFELWLDSHPDAAFRLLFWMSVLVLTTSIVAYNLGYERGMLTEFRRGMQLQKQRDENDRKHYEALFPRHTESRGTP